MEEESTNVTENSSKFMNENRLHAPPTLSDVITDHQDVEDLQETLLLLYNRNKSIMCVSLPLGQKTEGL